MAQYKGVNATKAADATGDNIISPGKDKAVLKVMYDTYEASSVAINDTILMGTTLPDGAVIQAIRVICDDLGTGVTLDVGDSNDDDRYDTAIDVASAASATWCDNIAGHGYVIGTNSGDNQIMLTVEGGSATGTIQISIFYSYA